MKGNKVPSPPPNFFTIKTEMIVAGTILHRNHSSTYRSAQFNPCQGQPTRFASFNDMSGTCVPSLYAATNREAAAFESIFHDVAPAARFKTVRLNTVQTRSVSRISPKKDLRVACLYAPDLKALGISRANLIETSKATYHRTVLWAQALHEADTDLKGLIWTSRQCDPERCLIFFGDRVKETDFKIVDCIDVSASASLLLELRNYGKRAGITII